MDVQDSVGNTPLFYAVRLNNIQIVSLLLKKEADPRIKDKKGHKAIDYATDLTMIRLLDQYAVAHDRRQEQVDLRNRQSDDILFEMLGLGIGARSATRSPYSRDPFDRFPF